MSETIAAFLKRRLSGDLYGFGQTIAKETGVSQTTVSNAANGGEIKLSRADKILAWIAEYDKNPRPARPWAKVRRQREPEGVTA